MHNSSLVAIAQYFWRIRTSVLWQSKKINTEAVNDYPPIRFKIRFERKFPIVGLLIFDPSCRNPVKSVPRGKAIWNANGGFVSVLLTHLFSVSTGNTASSIENLRLYGRHLGRISLTTKVSHRMFLSPGKTPPWKNSPVTFMHVAGAYLWHT